jgi:Hypoxia induced protein conserved region
MQQVLQILIPIVLFGVLVTIGLGFYSLYRGGEFARAWSNKLMRVRIALQALAVILVVLWIFVRGGHF